MTVKLTKLGYFDGPRKANLGHFSRTTPPEIATQKQSTHEKQIAWRLGCLYFKLVSGKYPIDAASEPEFTQKLATRDLEPYNQFSPNARELLFKLLYVPDPEERISFAVLINYGSGDQLIDESVTIEHPMETILQKQAEEAARRDAEI